MFSSEDLIPVSAGFFNLEISLEITASDVISGLRTESLSSFIDFFGCLSNNF